MHASFRLALLTAALAAITACASVTENFSQTYPFSPDGMISLENANGSIEITAWDKAEVSLVAEKRAQDDDGLKRISLQIEASPTRLTIRTKYAKRTGWSFFGNWSDQRSVHYKLMVPAGAKLDKIDAVNSDITVRGLRGSVNLETVNGRIDATGLQGDARLETVNGSLSVDFASLDQVRRVALETVNGSATVILPPGANASLKASSVNGGIHVDQPITLSRTGRHDLSGDLGRGGTSIRIETVNGGISIREQ